MKLSSFFLFVATGLILCTTLSAQQYHDALAFGLKGNVKEYKVISVKDGLKSEDPYGFCSLSFSKDGKLEAITKETSPLSDAKRQIYDFVRSNGRLTGFKYIYIDSDEGSLYNIRFLYNGGELIGSYTFFSFGLKDARGEIDPYYSSKGYQVYTYSESGKDSFKKDFFAVADVFSTDRFEALIEEEFKRGGNFLPKLESAAEKIWDINYDQYNSFSSNYIIKSRDSHGNYTVLTNEKDGESIKRIITYWDDSPTASTTTQATKSPTAATASTTAFTGTTVSSRTSGVKVVDMGFPSGVKWADRNIGAQNPEDYGDYYAWGETKPKAAYTWDSYAWGRANNLKKYNTTDKKLVLDPEDDIASVRLGSSWRMPTEEEMEELQKNCLWTLTTVNGVKGYELKSKINGNTIFLPAGGYYSENGSILKGGSGYYWTSTVYNSIPKSSEHLNFDDFSDKQYVFSKDRYIGMSVRPVTVTAAKTPSATRQVQAPAASGGQASRQYHDALAFGLKGNVKECKVVSVKDGTASYDPHHFSTVSFTSEGKLMSWFDDSRKTKDLVLGITDVTRDKNQQPLVFELKESSYRTEAHYFQYKGEQLAGSYILSWEDDDIFGRVEDTRVSVISEGANNSLTSSFFGVGDVIPDFTKLIRQELYKGGDILPSLKKYVNENMYYVNEYRSFISNYTIKERDSHGNYTILTDSKSGDSIQRIITYWDDSPTSYTTTQATKSPVAATASTGTTVSSSASGMRVVDMGFPSGVKWADRNIGAQNPEDYGDYYAWGETKPKAAYTWDNYAWGRENNLKKYNTTDKKLVLDPEDDIASVRLGSSWRMPTEEEMEELRKNCIWTLTTVNGVKGFELKSKINGNTIFLPAGGYYSENGSILKGTSGYYWTSSLYDPLPASSEHLDFDDFNDKQYVFSKKRYIGMSVRPVTVTDTDRPAAAPAAKVQETAKPEPTPKVTGKTPGLRPTTPKELSVNDLITRPFGVLSQNSRKLSMEQILFDLSDYGWNPDIRHERTQLFVDNTKGYDMTFLGEVPVAAQIQFTKNKLWCFVYTFQFDKLKNADKFADKLISQLRAEGVDVPDWNNNDANSRRVMYNNSSIIIRMPDPNYLKVRLNVLYIKDDRWIE